MCMLCYVYVMLCVCYVMCMLCYVYVMLCVCYVMCMLCYVYVMLCVCYVMCMLCYVLFPKTFHCLSAILGLKSNTKCTCKSVENNSLFFLLTIRLCTTKQRTVKALRCVSMSSVSLHYVMYSNVSYNFAIFLPSKD